MGKLISPESLSFRATITEDDLRRRMADEVLEQIGGLGPDGKRNPGVTVRVTRGDSRKGGYSIEVSGPVPFQMLLPRGGE